jgi:E3 ubiquitin-protein ligase MARCH6
MEWLSHSQKKYCELCKTPFRFTKLYDPQMPQTLPTTVFIRKAALHFLSYLTLWCRTALVAMVWLVCLPWAMRYIWRMLFWFGDLGWARDTALGWTGPFSRANKSLVAGNLSESAHHLSKPFNGTFTIPPSLVMTSRTLNASLGEPLAYKFAKTILSGAMLPFGKLELLAAMGSNLTDYDPKTLAIIKQKHSSILSEVRFLKHLTDSPVANRFCMDVLEGIIITLSVVVAFILIFLIREWVVQQQPVVDLGVAHAENALEQAGGQAQQPEADGAEEIAVAENATDLLADIPVMDDAFEGFETLSETSSSSRSSAISFNNLDLGRLGDHVVEASSTIAEPSNSPPHIGGDDSDYGDDADDADDAEKTGLLQPESVAPQLHLDTESTQSSSMANPNTLESLGNLPKDAVKSSSGVSWPDMPPQGTPSPAMEFQRILEERILDSGENGLGSWQDIEDLEEGLKKEDSSKTNRSSSKGKGRADVDDLGHSRLVENGAAASEPHDTTESSKEHDAEYTTEHPVLLDAAVERPSTAFKEKPAVPVVASADEDHGSASSSVSERQQPTVAQEPAAHQGWPEYLYDWFWGDLRPDVDEDDVDQGVVEVGENDERIVQDVADEEPFVPFAQARPVLQEHDRPRVEGLAPDFQFPPPPERDQARLDLDDAEAADEVEDLDGILELIGMQGPILGLFQNALFSGLLITGTIMCSVLCPYLLGKIVLLFVGTPNLIWKTPLQVTSGLIDFTADILAFLGGHAAYFSSRATQSLIQGFCTISRLKCLGGEWIAYQPARAMAERAGSRLAHSVVGVASLDDMAVLHSSIRAHETVQTLQNAATLGTEFINTTLTTFSNSSATENLHTIWKVFIFTLPNALYESAKDDYKLVVSIVTTLWKNAGNISLNIDDFAFNAQQRDPILAYWNAKDRMAAVITGYAWMAVIGAIYVTYFAPVTTSPSWRRMEQAVVEIIQQAGGVFKVIFIISIEMIAFPLFCGFLLDMALLPLFEHSTFISRVAFTMSSPWTSGFVHWFVGTCYMFHFALFVSMCRKIMRGGVLYFIRDPDDPNFHPVRDVLERSVAVQLRKIAFSAIVYGTLIVVCLGAVVWGLWTASANILPIHWASSESALEFPLDILFYNFLTPVVVRYAKPTDGLHSLYTWWFKRCARALRLSEFLLDQKQLDEEGHHVRRTWKAWIFRTKGRIGRTEGTRTGSYAEAYFEFDGRFVRAPASDQIRIPKGGPVFIEVDMRNNRLDGLEENDGPQSFGSKLIRVVYIPPWFRVRIGLFTLAVWVFAATTGLSVTIVPLLFGRKMFTLLVANPARVNDIYAFSLGVYTLGAMLYIGLHLSTLASIAQRKIRQLTAAGAQTLHILAAAAVQAASVIYVYSTAALGIPLLFAVTLQLYVLIPLHMYLGPLEKHTIHLVQDWTLGILYFRIFIRLLLEDLESLLTLIFENIIADGYFRPNARLATRSLFLPALLALATVTLVPYTLAAVVNATIFYAADQTQKQYVTRMAYPAVASSVAWIWCSVGLAKATGRWRARIRDEAYLIGERLHNFGESRKVAVGENNKDGGKQPLDVVLDRTEKED